MKLNWVELQMKEYGFFITINLMKIMIITRIKNKIWNIINKITACDRDIKLSEAQKDS